MHSGVLKESYRYPSSSKAPFFDENSWFLKVLKFFETGGCLILEELNNEKQTIVSK
jgi:hypothetical protein